MRLSEAIRKGAEKCPVQSYGVYFDGNGTCAIGAALEAVGALKRDAYVDDIEVFAVFQKLKIAKQWRKRYRIDAKCPDCEQRTLYKDITEIIKHLNNDHMWSRENIAAWVESIESASQPLQVEEKAHA